MVAAGQASRPVCRLQLGEWGTSRCGAGEGVRGRDAERWPRRRDKQFVQAWRAACLPPHSRLTGLIDRRCEWGLWLED